jgi:hypothetical protein
MHRELNLEPTLGRIGSAFPVLNAALAPSLTLILPLPDEPRGAGRIRGGLAPVTSSNLDPLTFVDIQWLV